MAVCAQTIYIAISLLRYNNRWNDCLSTDNIAILQYELLQAC